MEHFFVTFFRTRRIFFGMICFKDHVKTLKKVFFKDQAWFFEEVPRGFLRKTFLRTNRTFLEKYVFQGLCKNIRQGHFKNIFQGLFEHFCQVFFFKYLSKRLHIFQGLAKNICQGRFENFCQKYFQTAYFSRAFKNICQRFYKDICQRLYKDICQGHFKSSIVVKNY